MSELSRDIRKNVRSNVSVPGIIIDIFYDKASVKLTNNGAKYRNLDVVGGPVIIGQQVRVDFTTSKPTIVATGARGLTLDDIRRMLAQMDFGQPQEMQIAITLFSGGVSKAMYPPNETGFGQALSDANDGDNIFLPDIDVTGDFTIPTGVAVTGLSREQSIIRGAVDIQTRGYLRDAKVYHEADTSSMIYAVHLGDRARVDACYLYALNSGSSIGVYANENIDCYAVDNLIYAYVTEVGAGYGVFSVGARIDVTGGAISATTAPVGEIMT